MRFAYSGQDESFDRLIASRAGNPWQCGKNTKFEMTPSFDPQPARRTAVSGGQGVNFQFIMDD
jgi:hypothetical protein